MKSQVDLATKKPYERPQLRIYGDIQELTKNSTQRNRVDNSFLRTKT